MQKGLYDTLTTGCSSLDTLLEGGLPLPGVTLAYGEAETGKTSLAIQCAIYCARRGQKTLFIDSDGTFSTQRLSQIAQRDLEKISSKIILMQPTTFREQGHTIGHLDRYASEKFGLIVIDTITSLYRVELGGPDATFTLNRELNGQVASLAEVAKTRRVAVFITSQVRSVFLSKSNRVEPVATRTLKFWSSVVLSLKHAGQKGVLKATRQKHPRHKRPASCYITLEKTGILDYG